MKNPSILYAEKLMNIVISTVSLLETLGEDFMAESYENGKWDNKQILGHLIDSAYHNHQRIILTLTKHHMIFSGYNQDQWVEKNQYKLRSSEEVIQTFISSQQHFAILISGISEQELLKNHSDHKLHETSMSNFGKNEKGSLSFLIWDYIFHVEHHLSQIIKGYKNVHFKEYYK